MKKTKQIIFEKTIHIFAWFVFSLAVFMSLTTIFASLSGEENGKEIFGSKMLIVTSDSMSKSAISENEEIFFNAGDLIIIKKVESLSSLKEGDVITFVSYNPESYGKTVTHKIREIRYSSGEEIAEFVTYGINKGTNDTTPVKPENIIGKYSFKLPMIGNLFAFLKTSRGFYLSILIPAVLLIIFFSIKIGKILGKKRNQRRLLPRNRNSKKKSIRLGRERRKFNYRRNGRRRRVRRQRLIYSKRQENAFDSEPSDLNDDRLVHAEVYLGCIEPHLKAFSFRPRGV